MKKIVVTILAVALALGVGWYFFSGYLVSKLDGTGGVSAPQEQMEQYSSEDGVQFQYPNRYELSSRTEGNAERQWDTLVLLPKGYVPPVGGEGPPTISMSVFQNPEGFSASEWVKGDARSNWKLTVDDRASKSMVVGGQPALWYHYSGLYETDSVAVAHKGKIFLFSVGWLEPQDQIRTDFNQLVSGVQFY